MIYVFSATLKVPFARSRPSLPVFASTEQMEGRRVSSPQTSKLPPVFG
jgi:hypothetical protein